MLRIDQNKCTLCRACLNNCPFGALEYIENQIQVNDRCTLCGSCVNVCHSQAIHIERKQATAEELAQYSGVYVWVELEERTVEPTAKKVALELLSKGRQLAETLQEELVAVVIGANDLADQHYLGEFGADRVLLCRHELLAEYSTDGYTSVLSALIAARKPAVLLYGATPNGRDLAPRVAARLRLGLTADCTGLEVDENRQLVQTRPAFGGNIMASIVTPATRPQTATVRPNVFKAVKGHVKNAVVIEEFPVVLKRSAIRTRVLERHLNEAKADVKINEASVIVAAGRGCQRAENLAPLQELATLLGGTLAGSRAVVEEGWLDHTRQVGQSGTTVSPELYLAVGISGAVQHLVGMSSSGTIVAINKDPQAPIHKVADLSIVGDALTILPRLIVELKKKDQDR